MIKNMVKFFSGVIVMLAAVSAYAVTISGTGFTPLGYLNLDNIENAKGPSGEDYVFGDYIGGFFLVLSKSPRTTYKARCDNEDAYRIERISGTSYYGAKLRKGVYLVFYEGPFVSVVQWPGVGASSGRGYFDKYGQLRLSDWAAMPGDALCIGYATLRSSMIYPVGDRRVSGLVKYGLYVKKSAESGTNVNFSIYAYRTLSSTVSVNESVQVNLVNCSVNTPSSINFQDIPAGSTAPVINNSNIGINCSGNEPSTMSIKYSMEPLSDTANDTSLMMKNPQNELQGYVRGFIGPNAGAEAGCTDASSSMRFNQDPIPLLEGVDSNGLYSLDLNWVLCPDATPGLGEGTASTVLNITWP